MPRAGRFLAVTSLNLRIARWLTCPLPSELETYIATPAGGLLLAGPPGSGKTTLLRSLVQKFCEGETIVSVIDERGELMACESGDLPRAARIRWRRLRPLHQGRGHCHGADVHEPAHHRL